MDKPTTEEIAFYMRSRFIAELNGTLEIFQMPRFPMDLLEECNFATKLLVKASRNQSKCKICIALCGLNSGCAEVMSWSVLDYLAELSRRNKVCRGRNENLETELIGLFPPLRTGKEYTPCVVVDEEGRILLWYLTGLLALKQQV